MSSHRYPKFKEKNGVSFFENVLKIREGLYMNTFYEYKVPPKFVKNLF